MKLSGRERLVLEYLTRGGDEVKVIPEDMRSKFTPEMLQFTLAELEAKGLVEYVGGAYTPTKKAEELFKKKKPMREEITAWGHPDITATNDRMIKITKEERPLNDKDSIIAVKANKSCKDLDELFKDYLKFGKKIKIMISVDGIEDTIKAFGSPALELTNEKNIVITKLDFIDGGTLVILADKAACDLKKELRKKLKDRTAKLKIVLKI